MGVIFNFDPPPTPVQAIFLKHPQCHFFKTPPIFIKLVPDDGIELLSIMHANDVEMHTN
jgi:hypothetical protein